MPTPSPFAWLDEWLQSGDRNHDYCRNPDGDADGAWCYIDADFHWRHCDVPQCQATCGTEANHQVDYAGTISTTASGKTCADWNGRYGLQGNYCRNPTAATDGGKAYCELDFDLWG